MYPLVHKQPATADGRTGGLALHGWTRLLGVLLGCLHRRGDLPGAGRPTRDQTDPLPPGPPGTLIRVTPISGLSVLPNSRAWAFLYHSRDFDGHDVAVSGVVVAPPGAAPPQRRPVLVWAHGSVGLADRCAPSRGRVVMLAGHSVGGHAVLWAAELARSYAPELQVLGMATTAPGAELATILKLARFRPAAITSGAMLIVAAWSDAYRVPPDVLTPAGRKALDRVRTTCLQELASDPATPVVRPGNLLTTPPWPALLARNTPGRAATPAPVLIAQGSDDEVVVPAATRALVKRLCHAGDTVKLRSYRGAGHLDIPEVASADMIGWIGDRLTGRRPRSTCQP